MQKIVLCILSISTINANVTIQNDILEFREPNSDRIFNMDNKHNLKNKFEMLKQNRSNLRGNILISNMPYIKQLNAHKVKLHGENLRVLLNFDDYLHDPDLMWKDYESLEKSDEIDIIDMEDTDRIPNQGNEDPLEVPHYEGKQCMHGVRKNYGCMDCYCVGGQIYLCSSLKCPVISQLQLAKVEQGNLVNINYLHCTPRTWHTQPGDSNCKNCLCVDGEQSFCFLNFCFKKFAVVEPNRPIKLSGIQIKTKPKTKLILQENKPLSNSKVCPLDLFITLGSDNACKFCVCMETGIWRCFQVLDAMCSSYLQKDHCHPGDTIKNSLSACSLCYCGINGIFVCSTDENCAHNIRELKVAKNDECDSILCLYKCRGRNRLVGICLKDGCRCINR